MVYNFVTNIEQCRLLIAEVVPLTLIYYSHFAATIVSLLIGCFVLYKDKSIASKILFSLTVVFASWLLTDIILWTSADSRLYMFFWSFAYVLEVIFFILGAYFIWVFTEKKDAPFFLKLVSSGIFLVILLSAGSSLALTEFDIVSCLPIEGPLWENFIFPLEIGIFLIIVLYSLVRFKTIKPADKKPFLLVASGISLFLVSFSVSGYLVDLMGGEYIYELIGIVGMLIFLAILAFVIVQYKAFNVKLIAAQALVITLIILIGSQFFFIQNDVNKVLNGITLVLSMGFGFLLVRSVMREVKTREKLEALSNNLQAANTRLVELDKQKNEFVSFATHQIRSPLASMRGNVSMILEGDFGPITDKLREPVSTMLISIKTLASVVDDYLNISRIELGTMKYDMKQIDFKNLLKEVVNEQKPNIDAKGLVYSVSLDEAETYNIKADLDKFKQVIMNVVDNSVKYTSKGSIALVLEKNETKGTIRFTVTDTGTGIAPDVMPKLFRKFSRAENASESNIHGTGLGLFIAKEIVTAHGGKIWAESEGEGKGSRFVVEMPEVR